MKTAAQYLDEAQAELAARAKEKAKRYLDEAQAEHDRVRGLESSAPESIRDPSSQTPALRRQYDLSAARSRGASRVDESIANAKRDGTYYTEEELAAREKPGISGLLSNGGAFLDDLKRALTPREAKKEEEGGPGFLETAGRSAIEAAPGGSAGLSYAASIGNPDWPNPSFDPLEAQERALAVQAENRRRISEGGGSAELIGGGLGTALNPMAPESMAVRATMNRIPGVVVNALGRPALSAGRPVMSLARGAAAGVASSEAGLAKNATMTGEMPSAGDVVEAGATGGALGAVQSVPRAGIEAAGRIARNQSPAVDRYAAAHERGFYEDPDSLFGRAARDPAMRNFRSEGNVDPIMRSASEQAVAQVLSNNLNTQARHGQVIAGRVRRANAPAPAESFLDRLKQGADEHTPRAPYRGPDGEMRAVESRDYLPRLREIHESMSSGTNPSVPILKENSVGFRDGKLADIENRFLNTKDVWEYKKALNKNIHDSPDISKADTYANVRAAEAARDYLAEHAPRISEADANYSRNIQPLKDELSLLSGGNGFADFKTGPSGRQWTPGEVRQRLVVEDPSALRSAADSLSRSDGSIPALRIASGKHELGQVRDGRNASLLSDLRDVAANRETDWGLVRNDSASMGSLASSLAPLPVIRQNLKFFGRKAATTRPSRNILVPAITHKEPERKKKK